MFNTLKLSTIGFAVMLVASANQAQAQSVKDIVVNTAAKWASAAASATKDPESAAISTVRRNEAWGDSKVVRENRDPMPFRGRPEQLADERKLDDRFIDKEHPVKASARAYVKNKKAVNAQERSTSRNKITRNANTEIQETAIKKIEAQEDYTNICSNISKIWKSSAYLAQQGQTDKAYLGYLKATQSCRSDKDVTATIWQAVNNLPVPELEQFLQQDMWESGRYSDAYYALKSGLIYAYNKDSSDSKIMALAPSVTQTALDKKDSSLLGVLGWAYQRQGQHKEAEQLFRAALKSDANSESLREGLVYALLAQNKTIQATSEIDKLTGDSQVSARAALFTAQARTSYKNKEYSKTLIFLEDAKKHGAIEDNSILALKAWALRASGQPQDALDIFKELNAIDPSNVEYASGYVESVVDTRDVEMLKKLYESPPAGQSQRIREAYSAALDAQGRSVQANAVIGRKTEQSKLYAGGLFLAKSKSGDAGKDKLSMNVAPEVYAGIDTSAGKVEVAASKITVNDGEQSASGSELRLTYAENLSADSKIKLGVGASTVSSTTRLTVDSSYRQYVDSGFIEGGLSVAPVMDTVRSYAGKSVAAGGKYLFSGQAMASKLDLNGVNSLTPDYKLTWAGAIGTVSGKNFASTSFFDTRAAITRDFSIPRFSWAAIGPEVRLTQYSVDQNRWEAGYGGFYSPLSEMGAGLRYSLMTTEGNRSLFKVTGFAGLVKKEFYDGTTSGGALVEADAAGALLLSKYLIAKGGINLKSSTGYTDLSAYAGVELSFEPRSKVFSTDLPTGLKTIK